VALWKSKLMRFNIRSKKEFTKVQKKIVRGTFWMFVGVLISKIFDLTSLFFVARYLPVEDFGKLSIIKSSVQTFVIFTTASLGLTATKYMAKLFPQDKEKTSIVLSFLRLIIPILGFVLSLIIFFFSDIIAQYLFNDLSLVTATKLMAVAFFFSSLNAFQKGVLAGFEEFKIISILSIASGSLNGVLMIFSAYHYGLTGTFFVIAINSFFIWLISIYFTNRSISKRQIEFKLGRFNYIKSILFSFTIPSFMSGLLVTPTIWYCNLLLIGISDGYVEMALYTAAYNLALLTITINSVIGKVFYPIVMKSFNKNNIFIDKINLILPFMLGVAINTPLIIFPEVMGFAYGVKYNNHHAYLTLVLILNFTIIMAFKDGIARNFAAANLMWFSFFSNLMWASMAIISMNFLKDEGSIGRALSFLLAYIISNLIFVFFYIRKELIPKNSLSISIIFITILVLLSNAFYYFEIKNLSLRIFGFILIGIGHYFSFKNWIFKNNE